MSKTNRVYSLRQCAAAGPRRPARPASDARPAGGPSCEPERRLRADVRPETAALTFDFRKVKHLQTEICE